MNFLGFRILNRGLIKWKSEFTTRYWQGREAAARSFVARKLDYEIVETNFRTREGEIDIVARSDHELVFIEVKTRTSKEFGHGVEQISRTKAERLQTAARRYLGQNGLDDVDWRLDLLVVEMTRSGRVLDIQHVENAIEEQG